MHITPIELVGLAAAGLTTPSFIPQAIKILRTRETKAISLGMYAMFTAGTTLWVIYGMTIGSPGIIIGNAISLVFVAAILVLKLKHG